MKPRSLPDAALYPYVLAPKTVPAIWGGDALVRRFGKPGDPKATLGESWECWDANRIANGSLEGITIAELRVRLGSALMGNLDPEQLFPILTKIIDARDALSVQVHPGDAYAQRVEHQRNGKTECWYVLDARPQAQLVLGWAKDTSREEYEERVADGTLGDILRHVPVRSGQTFYLPAGTLHAIGAGIIIFETQQASDLTYRIFDWNRVGAQGKARELHVQKAADVLDFHQSHAGAITSLAYLLEGIEREALIADPRFIVERMRVPLAPRQLTTEGRPLIFMTLNSSVDIRTADGAARLQPYQTALVPASAQQLEIEAIGSEAAVMFVTPPARADAMEERLQTAGVQQARIDAFLHQFTGSVTSSGTK